MNFEVLKRSHIKRNIIIAVIIILILSAVILTFTKAKYKTTASIPLVNGTINYDLSDLNLIGAYIQEGEEYKQVNEIPLSGYEFNEEKSYCTVNGENINATINFDVETQTLSVVPLTKKGTKCYLYFDEKDICEGLTASKCILTYEGGAEAIEEKGTPDFSKTATTDEGMYAAEDDYGTSYYYRGAVNDNWVQFGTNNSGQLLYWRIVRINGDESIRLIYNGISTATTGDDTMINASQAFNNSRNDNMYVGYMFQSGQVHGLQISSNIKIAIDNWYNSNLADEAHDLEENAGFCGDRHVISGTGIGNSNTDYAAYNRLINSKNPSFKCIDNQDLYTTKGSSKGNKALSHPIGLISADEVAFAGGVYSQNNNSSYYLYNNTAYWTMTPNYFYDNETLVFLVDSSGRISASNDVTRAYGVRPVINLRSDVALSGSGTTTDPFKVVGAE